MGLMIIGLHMYYIHLVEIRGVMIPLFYGTGIGTGTLAKRIGIGTAWNQF